MHIFTKHERLILLLCMAVFFVGSSLRYIYKKYPQATDLVNFIDSPKSRWKTNLNTANRRELISVPYIGEYTADKIIQYRKEHVKFTDVEELKKIKGVRQKNFERFKDYLYVR